MSIESAVIFLRALLEEHSERYQSSLRYFVETVFSEMSEDSEDFQTAEIGPHNLAGALRHFFPEIFEIIKRHIQSHFLLYERDKGKLKPSSVMLVLIRQYLKAYKDEISSEAFIRKGLMRHIELGFRHIGLEKVCFWPLYRNPKDRDDFLDACCEASRSLRESVDKVGLSDEMTLAVSNSVLQLSKQYRTVLVAWSELYRYNDVLSWQERRVRRCLESLVIDLSVVQCGREDSDGEVIAVLPGPIMKMIPKDKFKPLYALQADLWSPPKW